MTYQHGGGESGARDNEGQGTKGDLTLHGTITFSAPQQPNGNRRRAVENLNGYQTGFDRWTQRIGAIFTVIFTGGLVVVGLLQWCVYTRQAEIMDKQADIAASQTRAFVYVDKLATTIDANGNFIGDIEWGNSGNTPTKELTVLPGFPDSLYNGTWGFAISPSDFGNTANPLSGTLNFKVTSLVQRQRILSAKPSRFRLR